MFRPQDSIIFLVPEFSPIADKQILELIRSELIPFNLDLGTSGQPYGTCHMIFPQRVWGEDRSINTTVKDLSFQQRFNLQWQLNGVHELTFKLLLQRLMYASQLSTTDVTGGEKGWSLILRKASLLKSSFLEDHINWLQDCLFSFLSLTRHVLRSGIVLARISSKVRTSSSPRGNPWEIHQAGNEGMYPGLRRILAFIYPFLGVEVVMMMMRSNLFVKQLAGVGGDDFAGV